MWLVIVGWLLTAAGSRAFVWCVGYMGLLSELCGDGFVRCGVLWFDICWFFRLSRPL